MEQAKKSNKALIVMVGFILILFGWFAYSSAQTQKKIEAERQLDMMVRYYVDMEPNFIVNLAAGSPKNFLMMKASIVVLGRERAELAKKHMPAVRAECLKLLSEKNPTDLETVAQREELRKKMLSSVQNILNGLTQQDMVVDLLITHFVME